MTRSIELCATDGCAERAVDGWSHLWCAEHDEERQIAFELALDAATNIRQVPAERLLRDGIRDAAEGIGNPAAAIQRELIQEGHLVPDDVPCDITITAWATGEPGRDFHLQGPMDPDQFETWMKQRGLRTGEYLTVTPSFTVKLETREDGDDG